MPKQVDWIKFHHNFPEDDAIEALSDAAFRAWVRAICLSDRLDTDGRLTKIKVASIAKSAVRKELVRVNLWIDAMDGGIEIPKYLTWQRSAAEKDEARRKKSKAGRLGGLASGEARREANAEANASPPAEANVKQTGTRGRRERESPSLRKVFNGSGPELPSNKDYAVLKLLGMIGDHADEGTPGVIRSLAQKLPETSLNRVRESLTTQSPRDRARYAVGALKSEIAERQAAA